jgi:cell division protease FtsH
MLGGRAAEEIIFEGVISTGASNDLERASELARQMVMRFGMSRRLGPLTYGRSLHARYLSSSLSAEERNFSERTAEQIDDEVRGIIDESYTRVNEILMNRRTELEKIAEALIHQETLDRAELDRMLAPSPQPLIA